jgi:hypothetical protein
MIRIGKIGAEQPVRAPHDATRTEATCFPTDNPTNISTNKPTNQQFSKMFLRASRLRGKALGATRYAV